MNPRIRNFKFPPLIAPVVRTLPDKRLFTRIGRTMGVIRTKTRIDLPAK